jgi:hypothetical protein
MASASLRALLSGLIDYAGLFPPAGLSLADVVENYATYRRSDDQWALGRLVVPAARLDELVTLVPSNSDRWPVSALVGENVEADAARIAVVQGATEFVVQSAEVRATSVEQVRTSVDALSNVAEVYVEVPLTDELPKLIKAVRDAGARAKIRTGGVVADAIPAAASCARFMEACVSHDVSFKATAGLHHPMRGTYPLTYASDAPRGAMFGFLNVFVAAALARYGMSGVDLEQALVDSSPDAFLFTDSLTTWRDYTLTLSELQSTRSTSALSFGSCSFREPIDDLTRLGILTA